MLLSLKNYCRQWDLWLSQSLRLVTLVLVWGNIWWAWSTSLWFSKISWDPCTFDCFLIFKITLDCQFFNYFYEHQDDKCVASNILELIENDKVNVWDCGRLNWNHKKIPFDLSFLCHWSFNLQMQFV